MHWDWKRRSKPIFTDDTISYVENPKESIKSLEVMNKFSKVAEYKVNIKNQLYFYTIIMKSMKMKLSKYLHS